MRDLPIWFSPFIVAFGCAVVGSCDAAGTGSGGTDGGGETAGAGETGGDGAIGGGGQAGGDGATGGRTGTGDAGPTGGVGATAGGGETGGVGGTGGGGETDGGGAIDGRAGTGDAGPTGGVGETGGAGETGVGASGGGGDAGGVGETGGAGGTGGAGETAGAGGAAGAGSGAPCPATDEAYVDSEFFDDFDGPEIDNHIWLVAGWQEHGGQTSPDRCFAENGNLNLVFINDSTIADHYLSAAIQTQQEFYYGRWEARLKPSDVPGVLNSMYTIDWDNTVTGGDGTKQEIDIEFLTYSFADNSGEVHFAVHAEGLTSMDTNPDIPLDFNPSDDFHVWGFDITPEQIEWFVDDRVLLTYRYSENDITIDAPYQLKFNVWSDTDWINGPPEADVECLYLIDWVRFTPYPCG